MDAYIESIKIMLDECEDTDLLELIYKLLLHNCRY